MTNEQDEKLLQQELVNVMRRMRRMRLNVLSEHVIYTEYHALEQIDQYMQDHPGSRGIFVSKLAHNLSIVPSAASRLLNSLEGKNLVEREVDTKDRRNTFVRLTPQGAQILTQTARDMDEMKAQLIRRMGHEDISKLIELWNKLADLMEEEVDTIIKRQKKRMEEQS